ncbi:MAG: DUF2505 family protein [Myxococcales bacterium]|nr:DUF2505 family protein [Myxococcales bacterium]USN50529.1 MAG: DUF2505 family protein [Myxococcales bacterium]
MATSFSLEHCFPHISLEKFEAHLNDPALNTMLEKGLDFEERKLLIKDDKKNGEVVWTFRVKKLGQWPSAVKKIIQNDSFSWQEISHYVPEEHCVHWEIVPEIKGIKFHGQGVWKLSKSGKGCKRVIEGKISVDIPFLGKVVESFIVNELKNTYEIEPKIQEKFYASVA